MGTSQTVALYLMRGRERKCVSGKKDMNGLTRTATLTFSPLDCSLRLLPLILPVVMFSDAVQKEAFDAGAGMKDLAADS